MIPARIITCSDAGARGEREDRSGPALRELLEANGYKVDRILVVPDDIDVIGGAIMRAAEQGARLIVTNGGTGVGPRDFTPEATMRVCERIVPGFGELMRAASLQKTPMAALSRAQACTCGPALVVNVPGSVAGAVENLQAVMHLIPHALDLLAGNTEHA
jgi:molybdenum cofactor synthesis domain-containing protein